MNEAPDLSPEIERLQLMYDSGRYALLMDARTTLSFDAATEAAKSGLLLAKGPFEVRGPLVHSFSDGFLALSGYSADELISRPLGQLFVPCWSEARFRELEAQLRGNSVLREHSKLLTRRLGIVDVELELSQLNGKQPEAQLLHLVVRDAYTHETMASRIAGLVSSFDAVQSEVHMGTWELAPDEGWVMRYSPEVLTIYGLTREQMESNPDALTDSIHPTDRAYALQALQSAVQERKQVDLLYRVLPGTGELRWVRVRATPIETASRRGFRMVGVVFDVTSRVTASATLHDAEQRYQTAAEASRDALVFLRAQRDRAGKILDFAISDVNTRACELLCCDKAALLESSVGALVPRFLSHGYLERFTEVVDCREPYEVTLRNAAPQLRLDWLQLQVVPLGDGVAVSVRDVSAERHLAAQLARAQRLESVGRMATGIAHDFNNMLSAINGFTTIARDSLTHDVQAQEDLEQALIAAARASRLTRYLLTFASRQPLTPDLVDVNEVLKEISRILARILGHDIRLTLELDPEVVAAWVDASQLEQAIINLATNARDAMPRGGQLRIATSLASQVPAEFPDTATVARCSPSDGAEVAPSQSSQEAFLCITVSDTGIGMDAATRDRVFEPFFTTKGPTQGTGLGLATLYGFVKQSGGHVSLDSVVGQGTSFRVYLPHRKGAKKSDPNAAPHISGSVSCGDETILLVDCDESVRRVARRILELHGYKVIEAANAGEAYFELESPARTIDLLLMSPQLPRVDATEFAIRAKQNRPTLGVLAMSGAVDQLTLDRFAAETDGQFLSKPLTPERLVHAVREALKRRAAVSQNRSAAKS